VFYVLQKFSIFFFDVPEMMTLITTTLVTSLSFGGWESSPTDVALYPSDDTNGVAGGGPERGRAGESVSWIGSRGLEELGTCFFWFSTRNLGASRFICWLVVWNMWIVFPYIGNNNPN
jgi:hypothetical protein